ncbi:MAG: cyclic pyranopterin monophosphate synthase MoaC [Hirschia sp.]|nr:cyclic pyranopterin monophosphate synthase MoaC [Hirschia sp.]MBF17719.1 cyclic pyranopterin monophosphate synthase MoaC [Hirschia sp.]|tara:strand:- start:1076 stop:1579 length:504 start_codon:yes stop_codon:yes gene_type:complete
MTDTAGKSGLTHIDKDGRARMVDVGDKDITVRIALAEGFVRMTPQTLQLAISGDGKKGDVRAAAEIAGVMAAKRTYDLIPMCHALALSSVKVSVEADEAASAMKVTARVKVEGRTGVEMEALTAVSVACLTLYDMLKAADRTMIIDGVRVLEKTGGVSGDYRAAERG